MASGKFHPATALVVVAFLAMVSCGSADQNMGNEKLGKGAQLAGFVDPPLEDSACLGALLNKSGASKKALLHLAGFADDTAPVGSFHFSDADGEALGVAIAKAEKTC